MATASDSPSEPVVSDKNTGKRQAHGLATLEQTPEPEAARLKEDEKRRLAELQPGVADDTASNTGRPQPSRERTGGATGENNGATQAQIDAVERVMKCSGTEYRQILGLRDENTDKEEEARQVMAAFKQLRCLTYENYNKVNHAAEAFHSKYDLLNFRKRGNYRLTRARLLEM